MHKYARYKLMGQFIRYPVIPVFVMTLALLGNAGLANTQEKSEVEEIVVIDKQPPAVNVPQSFGSSQIKNWYAPDSKTLIIETARGDFKATFANNCSGIMFAESIGFKSSGGTALDKFTTIVLPDGQTCFFKELMVYVRDDQDSDKHKPGE